MFVYEFTNNTKENTLFALNLKDIQLNNIKVFVILVELLKLLFNTSIIS